MPVDATQVSQPYVHALPGVLQSFSAKAEAAPEIVSGRGARFGFAFRALRVLAFALLLLQNSEAQNGSIHQQQLEPPPQAEAIVPPMDNETAMMILLLEHSRIVEDLQLRVKELERQVEMLNQPVKLEMHAPGNKQVVLRLPPCVSVEK